MVEQPSMASRAPTEGEKEERVTLEEKPGEHGISGERASKKANQLGQFS